MNNLTKKNPYVEYNSITEVERAAGFPILIPAVLGTESIEKIFLIDGKTVDIRYPNNIIYRTAQGTEDISGDRKNYDEEKEI